MAIEIVDFPIKNGDFPLQTVSSPESMYIFIIIYQIYNEVDFRSLPMMGTLWNPYSGSLKCLGCF